MIDKSPIWKELQRCCERSSGLRMQDLFADDPRRFQKFSCEHQGLFLDYSKNLITDTSFRLLIELARQAEVETWLVRLFAGEHVNSSERSPALHTVLRDDGRGPAAAAGSSEAAAADKARMYEICEAVRSGRRVGFSRKPLRHIVNIGIGGSHLGPAMGCKALAGLGLAGLDVSFITSVDGCQMSEVLNRIDPEKTLFIVTSKTFATRETLTNAQRAREWINSFYRDARAWEKHFLAVTGQVDAALRFGVPADNVLRIWNSIGGRFSLWSAAGVPLCILIGSDRFEELLAGALSMDTHFSKAPLASNMPVILALLDIWYVNFHGAGSRVVLPYDHALKLLPEYLQQLEMESNGKSVDREGRPLHYATAPVVWGKDGIEGQHAFYQLLHQGTQLVPADFIVTARSNQPMSPNDEILRANFLAQTRALMCGEENPGEPYRNNAGNKPSNALILDTLSPFTLGLLIALYEHKVFVQAVIWGINPFDQWGVDSGKRLAAELLDLEAEQLDSSTRGLLRRLQPQPR